MFSVLLWMSGSHAAYEAAGDVERSTTSTTSSGILMVILRGVPGREGSLHGFVSLMH